jgi:hypothetical protein
MKKYLAIATIAVFVLTLTAVTYAIDFKMSGDIRNRSKVAVNIGESALTPGSAEYDGTVSDVDMRMRFKIDAVASENLKGQLRFEMDDDWGGTGMGTFGLGSVDVEVRNAFVSFTPPGLEDYPTTLTAGLQDFYLGRFAVDEGGTGITVDTKWDPAAIRLIFIKEFEGDEENSDDRDSYGVRVTYPVNDWRPGVWFQWTDLGKITDSVAAGGAAGSGRVQGDLYWVGFTVDGKLGPVSLIGDFVYNGGSVDYGTNTGQLTVKGIAGPATLDEEEYGGWVAHVKGSMPVGDIYEVGGVLMYASGDELNDVRNRGEIDGFRQPLGGAAFRPTQIYYGSGINASIGLDSRVGSRGRSPTNVAGDWLVQGFVSAKPLDWLKVTVLAAYIGDNVDDGDRFGTSRDAAGNLEDNDDAGIELDVTANIQIYKQLTWDIGAGILFAGDALEQWNGTANEDPDDPWCFVTNLQYKF